MSCWGVGEAEGVHHGVVTRSARQVSLGGGVVVPYPEPSSTAATQMGKANRRTGTKPEVALRSRLHRMGLRFRKDRAIVAGGMRTRADIVFGPAKVAVFVDGCFWHSCPEHSTMPASNRSYWEPKLRSNAERDARVNAALAADGWRVLRIWEHTGPEEAARAVAALLSGSGR